MSIHAKQIPDRLGDILIRAAKSYPGHGVSFIKPDRSTRFYPYPELLKYSLGLLDGLHDLSIKKGDRVILSLDTSEEIIPTLWACFLGGIVPALLQPPVSFSEYNPAAEKAEKVFRLLEDPKVILSHRHFESWLRSGIPTHALVDLANVSNDHPCKPEEDLVPDDLALIQFSSGSTGDPKGVMLSHRNILYNIHDISERLELVPEDVVISWMPLFHDMGLMGFHLTVIYIASKNYLIDPVDFIKNPNLWLDTISENKGSITGCPNFGQVVVNRALRRKTNPDWDLSWIRAVFNGAEPISVTTMNEFNANLVPFKYNPVAMLPAYGMAEATLAVTFYRLAQPAEVRSFMRDDLLRKGIVTETHAYGPDVIQLVNLGKSLPHCEIRIIGEDGSQLPADRAGQVLVKGENVTSGYYNNPAATAAAIKDGWLHTGDLGFLHEGDLFIMGRLKDIIFINGLNYYAHDLETVAIHVEGVSYGRIVMVGYFDELESKDKIIVFIVAPDNNESLELFRNIQLHFLKAIGLLVDTFVPIKSNDIPRTSSGKIQRYKMVNRFLRGEFSSVVRLT